MRASRLSHEAMRAPEHYRRLRDNQPSGVAGARGECSVARTMRVDDRTIAAAARKIPGSRQSEMLERERERYENDQPIGGRLIPSNALCRSGRSWVTMIQSCLTAPPADGFCSFTTCGLLACS